MMNFMNSTNKEYAKIFNALSDEKRLNILELLRDGEKCACVITDLTGIKQTALSYHMKILCDSKLVSSAQVGKWVHYSLSDNGKQFAIQLLNELLTPNTKQTQNSFYLDKLEKVDTITA